MRKLSLQRRRVVMLAGSLAGLSGAGPVLLKEHPTARWVWLGLMAALMVKVIVLMARLRQDEGCV